MAKFRCKILSDEFIGCNNAQICRRDRAKSLGWTCPRKQDPYVVHASCFDLRDLIRDKAVLTPLLEPAVVHAVITEIRSQNPFSVVKSNA